MVIPKSRQNVFRALRLKLGDRYAAAVSWAGLHKPGRDKMARKAARTRKRRGGK